MKTTTDQLERNINKIQKENIAIMYIGNNIKVVYDLATLYSFNVLLKHQYKFEKAIEDIKQFKFYPDVIICDQFINDKYGLEVFDQINLILPTYTYKILLTNSKPNFYLTDIATRSKINEAIRFPFKKDILADKLRTMITSYKQQAFYTNET